MAQQDNVFDLAALMDMERGMAEGVAGALTEEAAA